MIKSNPSSPLTTQCESHKVSTHLVRPSASYSTQASEQNPKEVSNSLSVLLFKLFNILFLLFFLSSVSTIFINVVGHVTADYQVQYMTLLSMPPQ